MVVTAGPDRRFGKTHKTDKTTKLTKQSQREKAEQPQFLAL